MSKEVSRLSQTYIVKRAQEILDSSEDHLLKVLQGKVKGVTERLRTTVALELYKRRIPARQEGGNTGNAITMIKIVKNHLPSTDQTEEIEKIEAEAAKVIKKAKKKGTLKPVSFYKDPIEAEFENREIKRESILSDEKEETNP